MSSFGAAFYGAVASAHEQQRATEANARAAAEANAAQERMFHLSRGSEGSAFLPEYLKQGESEAASRAMATASALRNYYGTPEQIAARGAAAADRARPLLDQGANAISGIFSGDLERKRLEAAAPTFAARSALADTTRAGVMKGILDRLNAIRTANAAKGYVGTGSTSENLALRASIEGNQQAGAATAAANLQNESERQAIRDQILDLQLRSPELAGALASQYASLELLPGQVTGAISRAETAPFDYFRIGVGNPPPQVLAPWETPRESPWASVAAAGQGNLSALGRYYANRELAKQYAGRFPYSTSYYGYPGGVGPQGGPGAVEPYGAGTGEGYPLPDYSYGSNAGDAFPPDVSPGY